MNAGWVGLTRRGPDDPWDVEHAGPPWEDRHQAITETKAWADAHGQEWAVAHLVIDGPAWVVRPGVDAPSLFDQETAP